MDNREPAFFHHIGLIKVRNPNGFSDMFFEQTITAKSREVMINKEPGLFSGRQQMLNIDGASVPDPGSLYLYGAGRWGQGH